MTYKSFHLCYDRAASPSAGPARLQRAARGRLTRPAKCRCGSHASDQQCLCPKDTKAGLDLLRDNAGDGDHRETPIVELLVLHLEERLGLLRLQRERVEANCGREG